MAIGREQVIAQRGVFGTAADSASFGATPDPESFVFVKVTLYLLGGSGARTVTVTVGGITATELPLDPSVAGASTYAFYVPGGAYSDGDVDINMAGADPYYWWSAVEVSGLVLQGPSSTGIGTASSDPTHATVTTGTLAVANSYVIGYGCNEETQGTSGWSPPSGFTMGSLNIQDWDNASSGCSFYKITSATTPLVMTMTGDGDKNYGRIAFAVYDGADDEPDPAEVAGTAQGGGMASCVCESVTTGDAGALGGGDTLALAAPVAAGLGHALGYGQSATAAVTVAAAETYALGAGQALAEAYPVTGLAAGALGGARETGLGSPIGIVTGDALGGGQAEGEVTPLSLAVTVAMAEARGGARPVSLMSSIVGAVARLFGGGRTQGTADPLAQASGAALGGGYVEAGDQLPTRTAEATVRGGGLASAAMTSTTGATVAARGGGRIAQLLSTLTRALLSIFGGGRAQSTVIDPTLTPPGIPRPVSARERGITIVSAREHGVKII